MTSPLSRVMAGLADAIGVARSPAESYDAALAAVREATGVDRAAILLFDPDGVMRFKAWAGLSDRYRATVEGHTPWRAGDPPPEPLVVADADSDLSLAAFREVFRQEHIRALAFVPIVSQRRVIGKFMLYRAVPDRFDGGESAAALAIGYHIGFAVERLRREQELTAAHQRLLFALDAAQMGTWEWNLATNQVRWSENLERIHGLPPGTFTGQFASYQQEVHPEDRDRVLSSITRALEGGGPHDVEYRIVAPDGAVRWVHGKGRVEHDAQGRPARMTGVCMDVTARKRTEAAVEEALWHEAALRERLARLTHGAQRLLVSPAMDTVLDEVLELAGSVVAADAYAVWRRRGNEWAIVASRGLSRDFTEQVLTHPGAVVFDAPIVAEDVAQSAMLEARRAQYAAESIVSLVSIPLPIRSEPVGSIAFYYRAAHRPAEVELQVATALGQLAAAAVSNADLYAEQQRLRREAEEAQLRSAFLAEASELLSSLDYEGNLTRLTALAVPRLADWCAVDLLTDSGEIARLSVSHIDPAMTEWARELHRRYPPALADRSGVGFVLRSGVPQLLPDIPDELIAASARDEEHLRIVRELRLRSAMIVPLAAGRRTLGAITFVSTAEGRRFGAADLEFAMELARRAALAIENARLFQEAREANRVKDEFLATLSHELRTPLNVIMGRTRHLIDAGGTEAPLRRQAETIERNAQSLARLVDDLLDVSRFTLGQVALEMRPLDLRGIIQTALAGLEPMARAKGVTIRTTLPERLPIVGDATRLQQVVWNLVTNAIKFTPEGGVVSIEAARDNAHVRLRVADTGIGIAPDFLPHVFDMFRQADPATNRRYGGLGLGLSIVRRLVELHAGTVIADSAGVGEGASFRVVLPLRAAPDGGSAPGVDVAVASEASASS